MDVTEYFLPPGRHLLDACGDSGFDTYVDGLAVLFSQRAEGAADAGFQGRVKKVMGKGGLGLGQFLGISIYQVILHNIHYVVFQKGVKLGRQTLHRKESRWELLIPDFLGEYERYHSVMRGTRTKYHRKCPLAGKLSNRLLPAS